MFRALLLFLLVFVSAFSSASDRHLQQKWNECAETALSSYDPTEAGMTGAYLEMIEKCGLHPVAETSKGLRLLSGDCDWIYEYALADCASHVASKDQCNTSDDILLVSMSSWREFWLLSDKVFKREKFFELCRRVCLEGVLPERKVFADSFCQAR